MTPPSDIKAAELHILRHSLGLDETGRGTIYRNHFVTGEGSADHPDCLALVDAGLMKRRAGNALTGDMDLFLVTDEGKAVVTAMAPPPEKLTRAQQRYREWHNSGAADCGWSFGDWLKRPKGIPHA